MNPTEAPWETVRTIRLHKDPLPTWITVGLYVYQRGMFAILEEYGRPVPTEEGR